MPLDESFDDARRRLARADTLVIDEASMISRRIFEQVSTVVIFSFYIEKNLY